MDLCIYLGLGWKAKDAKALASPYNLLVRPAREEAVCSLESSRSSAPDPQKRQTRDFYQTRVFIRLPLPYEAKGTPMTPATGTPR